MHLLRLIHRLARRIPRARLSAFVASLLMVFLLGGCTTTYSPGALFAAPEASTHAARRRGCVDIKASLVADDRVPRSSALIAYELGNGCDDGHVVDLTNIKVTGRAGDRETKLAPYDPRVQLHAADLDGRMVGDEAVRYDGPAGSIFDQICVDFRGAVEAPDDGFGVVCLSMPGEHVAIDASKGGFYRALAGCTEETRYMHQDCWANRFDWEAPTQARVRLEAGLSYHAVPTSHLTLGRSGAASVSGASVGTLDAGTFDTRVTGFLTRAVYLGGETQIGFGDAPTLALGTGDDLVATNGLSVHMVGGAVLGLQSIRSGRFALRAELFGGARLVALTTHDASGTQASSFFAGAPVLEPRVAVDMWATPDFSIGLWGGSDVVAKGAWSTGLAFVAHTRSFDAR